MPNQSRCKSTSLIVFLVLNREHFTEKDLASLKQTLLNLIQNCEREDNALLTLFSLGERRYRLNHFRCHIEMDGCQKLINQLKINDITYM